MAKAKTRGLDTSTTDKTATTFAQGKRHLLVISIGNYKPGCGFNVLDYPLQDGKNFTEVLTNEYDFETVTEVKDSEWTRDKMEDAIRALMAGPQPRLKKDDGLVVLFSGHGFVEFEIPYWIGYDGTKAPVSGVLDLLIACSKKCRQVLLIIDCCFAGHAPQKAQLKTAFANLEKELTSFAVITAGNKDQVVPDKSIFMEALLDVLSTKAVSNLEQLVGDLKIAVEESGVATVVPFSSIDQSGLPFILRRTDEAAFELAEAFFKLNYKDQSAEIEGTSLFNTIYLPGTKECAHSLFTKRYFKENDIKAIDKLDYRPDRISFGNEAQEPDYDLWKKAGKLFEVSGADHKVVLNKIFKKLKVQDWVLIVRVDGNVENEDLAKSLVDFWMKTNEYLLSEKINEDSFRHKIFFFIWDRRGDDEEILEESIWGETPELAPTKLLHLPRIKPLDKTTDLSKWYTLVKQKGRALKKDPAFTNLDINIIKPPFTIQNVILQITDLSKKEKVYQKLFSND